jgi:HlyD family secretion protein
MKRWLLVATVIIAAAAVLFVTRQNKLRAEQTPQTVTITRGTIVQEALAIGNIVPEQEVSVKSKIAGIVAEVHVAVGDQVRKGEPLMDIRPDPTPLERAEARRNLEMAQVTEDGARRDLDRAQELFTQGLLSQKELDDRKSAYDSAHLRAQLEQERLDLLKEGRARIENREVSNRIVSPVDGTVLSLELHPGDPVVPLTSYQAGTVLMTLADMSDLIFRGTVDEVDVGRLEVGRPVRFTVGAIPDAKVEGTLRRISPKARKQDSATLFDIEATIAPAGSTVLRAGYSTNAKIAIARADSVLVLPERVVKYEAGKASVRVPGKDGKPESHEVTTGLSDGLMVEIKSGLDAGAVVLEPPRSTLAKK